MCRNVDADKLIEAKMKCYGTHKKLRGSPVSFFEIWICVVEGFRHFVIAPVIGEKKINLLC